MFNLVDKNFRNLCLQKIQEVIPKHKIGRKSKIDYNKLLDLIHFKVDNGLKNAYYKDIFNIPKTSANRHLNKLAKYDIFNLVHKQLINDNKLKLDVTTSSIDCKYIKSIHGSDNLGSNPTDRGRNATKICIIVDHNGIPYSKFVDKGNTSDTKMFNPTINCIPIELKKKDKKLFRLLADRGFVARQLKKDAKNNKFKLLIPTKNYKGGHKSHYINPSDRNILFGNRYKVERTNAWITNLRGINIRYERRFINYYSLFCYGLALICFKKFNKL